MKIGMKTTPTYTILSQKIIFPSSGALYIIEVEKSQQATDEQKSRNIMFVLFFGFLRKTKTPSILIIIPLMKDE
jgi:hypothetical protein